MDSKLYLLFASFSLFINLNASYKVMDDGNIDITEELEKQMGVYGLYAIHLNDSNWENITSGEWIIYFHAPWCPACENMTKSWDNLAKWSKDKDITVGKIDVTDNPGLNGRFLVMALPTIYYVNDGVFRLYNGSRSEYAVIKYLEDKLYESEDPVPWYSAPNTPHMTAMSYLFRIAMVIGNLQTIMTEEYGIPIWAIYAIFIFMTSLTGIILGFLLVCLCDSVHTPAPHESPKTYSELTKEKRSENKDNTSENKKQQ